MLNYDSVNIQPLCENVTSDGYIGTPLELNIKDWRPMPIQIEGLGSATVTFEASLLYPKNDLWQPISNGTFSTNICSSLSVYYPYIRVFISNYVSGNISVYIALI